MSEDLALGHGRVFYSQISREKTGDNNRGSPVTEKAIMEDLNVRGLIGNWMPQGGDNYLSLEGLTNLKYYKYSCIDESILAKYALRQYWDWATTLFPRWMAPNLITLLGFGFQIFSLLLVFIFVPDLGPTGPRWIYFCFAWGMWMYSTFDNVDGRQARRTNSSSPLGELFDHGCDAINATVGGIVQAAAFGLGYSWATLNILYLTTIPFYITTWEEYYTGIFYLGPINGPTEFIALACLGSMISGIFGPSVWLIPIINILPFASAYLPQGLTIIEFFLVTTAILAMFFHVGVCLRNVYRVCRERQKSFMLALVHLSPIVVFHLFVGTWISWSPTLMTSERFLLFLCMSGVVFGRMTTKVILGHLTRMPYPAYTIQLIPLGVGALCSLFEIFTPTSELLFLWASFIFVTVAYFHWATLVITSFCSHLGINCFRIPYQPSPVPQSASATQ